MIVFIVNLGKRVIKHGYHNQRFDWLFDNNTWFFSTVCWESDSIVGIHCWLERIVNEITLLKTCRDGMYYIFRLYNYSTILGMGF